MNRRELIALGSIAAAWPLAAPAQQQPIPVIGFLSSASPAPFERMLTGFRRGLAEGGFAEGRNVVIEYRWAEGRYDRLPSMAAELVSRPVAVLTSSGGEPAARAAMAATSTIPIVANFSIDPVARGFVKSLNRPGGNVTGVSNFTSSLEPKRLSLFRLLLPNVATFGVLLNPSFVDSERQLNELGDAARVLGLQIRELRASTDSEIDAAFASLARLGVSALFVQGDPYFFARRDKITGLAASYAVPAVYGYRDYAAAGGLMSYGIDLADIYRQNAIYVGRILRGAKPTELPVVQPTKFEFVINLKTAKALGTKFSDDLLSIADEVIE